MALPHHASVVIVGGGVAGCQLTRESQCHDAASDRTLDHGIKHDTFEGERGVGGCDGGAAKIGRTPIDGGSR